jgi:hypothetical protein
MTRPTDPIVEARSRGKYVDESVSHGEYRHRERHHRARGPPDGDDVDAYSIAAFCKRHGISEAFYYRLRELGLAPVHMKVGARVLISREAAAAWRRAREAATETAVESSTVNTEGTT